MKKFPNKLRHALWLTVAMLLTVYLLFGYKYRFIYNQGHSMTPTYENGDWLVLQKRNSLSGEWSPERFDVILVEEDGEKITKRVLGLPGDVVSIVAGVVHVHGKPLHGVFGEGKASTFCPVHLEYELSDEEPVSVPSGYIWIIGDNRRDSWYGLVKVEDIKGLIVL